MTWTPHECNEEADALSNLEYKDFDQGNRVHLDLKEFKRLGFHELIVATGEMFKSINDGRERRKEHNSTRKAVPRIPAVRGSKRLKWTDPW